MLHWGQQGVAVGTIEICSLNPLKKEIKHQLHNQNSDPLASSY